MSEARLRAALFVTYGLAVAWPALEMLLLVRREAARGDAAREESARRSAAGVKDVARGLVFFWAAVMLAAGFVLGILFNPFNGVLVGRRRASH